MDNVLISIVFGTICVVLLMAYAAFSNKPKGQPGKLEMTQSEYEQWDAECQRLTQAVPLEADQIRIAMAISGWLDAKWIPECTLYISPGGFREAGWWAHPGDANGCFLGATTDEAVANLLKCTG